MVNIKYKMKFLKLLLLCAFITIFGIQTADTGLIPNGILISSVKRNNLNAALAMKTTHLFIVPVSPINFVENPALVSKTLSLSNDRAPLTKFSSLDFDYQSDIVYLYDQQTASIITINKFQSITSFHSGVSRSLLVSVAVDWVSHNVYWTDPMFGWIVVQPGSPRVDPNRYKIIVDNLYGPRAIAVAPKNGYLFFSDVGATARIERASLTGEGRKVIVAQNILHPVSIQVDVGSSRIIWVDDRRDTIESADFNGMKRRIIRRQPHTSFFDVGIFRDTVSIVDLGDGKLKFFNKTTGDSIGRAIESKTQAFLGVGIYSAETQPPQLNLCLRKRCSDMCIGDSVEAHCVCREGNKLNPDSRTCTEDESSNYRGLMLAFEGQICRLDIRSVITAQTKTKPLCVPAPKDILFMDIDSWERKIIFATSDGIYENAFGKSPKHERLVSVTEQITGLSLDWTDKNIYWSIGGEEGKIMALSQQTLTDITVHNVTLPYPRNVLVLPLKRKLVWIGGDQGNASIFMSNINGSEITEIVPSETLTFPQSLAVDSTETVLFWSDNGFIRRCKLDGTEVTTIHFSMFEMPSFMAPYKGYFVYSSDLPNSTLNTIMFSQLNKPPYRLSINNASPLRGLKIMDQSSQPMIQNPCNILNGGCEHICLYDGKEATCQCNFGFTLDFNGQTCSSESLQDEFILVADWTHNEVYQVSMVTDDIRGFDVDGIDQPAAVAYNHRTQEVIWGETEAKKIKTAFIDGLNYTDLLDTSIYGSHPDRFAIDFTSGNIYYTSVNKTAWGFAGVGVLTPSGKHKKLIVDGSTPRDIVVDANAGLLFWTDHRADFPFVKRANMDGTDVTTIITANIKWPNGLAIDYTDQKLYLTDGLYNTIQRCTYNGDCEIIYTDPAAHMMDIDLMGDYLYFTAWNRPYIAKMHKMNTSDFTKLIERAELGRLDSISVFNSTEINSPVSEACSSNDGLGECSTFCLPTPTGFTCACEDDVKLLADQRTCENVQMTNSSDEETIFINKNTDVLQIGNPGIGGLDLVLSGSDLEVVEEQSDLPSDVNDQLHGAIHKRSVRHFEKYGATKSSPEVNSISGAMVWDAAIMDANGAEDQKLDRRNTSV